MAYYIILHIIQNLPAVNNNRRVLISVIYCGTMQHEYLITVDTVFKKMFYLKVRMMDAKNT